MIALKANRDGNNLNMSVLQQSESRAFMTVLTVLAIWSDIYFTDHNKFSRGNGFQESKKATRKPLLLKYCRQEESDLDYSGFRKLGENWTHMGWVLKVSDGLVMKFAILVSATSTINIFF